MFFRHTPDPMEREQLGQHLLRVEAPQLEVLRVLVEAKKRIIWIHGNPTTRETSTSMTMHMLMHRRT
jgi:hypothetical protein